MQVLQRELKGLPYIIALFFECAPNLTRILPPPNLTPKKGRSGVNARLAFCVRSFASLYQNPPRSLRTDEEASVFSQSLAVMADLCTREMSIKHLPDAAHWPLLVMSSSISCRPHW